MRIFLDAKDLIELLERARPLPVSELGEWLRTNSHTLVVSPTVVFEVAAPLVSPSARTVVTRLLNDLESLPLEYIADGLSLPAEIRAAINAQRSGTEYSPIDPYVGRLDAGLEALGPLPTRMYLNFPLAEIVWTIAQDAPTVFAEKPERERRLRAMLTADRAVSASISVAEFFPVKLGRDLASYRIPVPEYGCDQLGRWIYASPNRCPALRLDYEVYHQICRNITDPGYLQDFEDFGHVRCIPYVDAATLDRRMAAYVQQVTKGWSNDHGRRVHRDLADIIQATQRAV